MIRKKSESEQMGIVKDSSKHELVELFEWMSSLCRVGCRYSSFLRVHLAWKRFWNEVARSMSKSLEESPSPPVSVAEKSPIVSRPILYRIGSIHRYSRSLFSVGKQVPLIRISGLWLEDYFFKAGRRFEIYPDKNQLILRLVSVVEPSGVAEWFPSFDPDSDVTVIGNV